MNRIAHTTKHSFLKPRANLRRKKEAKRKKKIKNVEYIVKK